MPVGLPGIAIGTVAGGLSGAMSKNRLFGVRFLGKGQLSRAVRAGLGATLGASLSTGAAPGTSVGISSATAIGSETAGLVGAGVGGGAGTFTQGGATPTGTLGIT